MTLESTFEYKEERPSPGEKEFEESAANRGCCEFCFFLIQFNKAQAKRLEHQRQYQLNNNKGRRQQKSPSVRDRKILPNVRVLFWLLVFVVNTDNEQ